MCVLTRMCVCVCVHMRMRARIRKCAYTYLPCPRASLMFLHLVKFPAASRCCKAAHVLLLCRRNRGVTEALGLFQCQRQPHGSVMFDGEEEAAGSPFGMSEGLQLSFFSFAKKYG